MRRKKDKEPEEKRPEEKRKGQVYIEAIDQWVEVRRTVAISYYYAIQVPQDVESRMIIRLFLDHLGDPEWTNFARPEMLPVGHEALIYKVSLSVRPTAEVRIVDIITALQNGSIAIRIGADEFINEPLCFFPVTVYGEIAARENDLLQSLAMMTEFPDGMIGEKWEKFRASFSGIAIPSWIAESERIAGCVDLGKGAYGTPGFDLFVVLHSITKMPIE